MWMIMAFAHVALNDSIRFAIQLAGIATFCIRYLRVKVFDNPHFRYLLPASIMIWRIVFNHLAESPMYIIAATGIALWYAQSQRSRLYLALLTGVFVLSSLSPTDVFPANPRKEYIIPYALKALPCFLVWIAIKYKMFTGKFKPALS